jgi:hypothetical protein
MSGGLQLLNQELRIADMAAATPAQAEQEDGVSAVEERLRALESEVGSIDFQLTDFTSRTDSRLGEMGGRLDTTEGTANRNASSLSRIHCDRRRCRLR